MNEVTQTPARKAPRFHIVGMSDVTTCDCCGRHDLRRTVRLMDGDGFTYNYGTGCAAKAMRRPELTSAKALRIASEAEAAKDRFYAQSWATRQISELLSAGEVEKAAKREAMREADYVAWVANGSQVAELYLYRTIPGLRPGFTVKARA